MENGVGYPQNIDFLCDFLLPRILLVGGLPERVLWELVLLQDEANSYRLISDK
jgi:hypothetical protein